MCTSMLVCSSPQMTLGSSPAKRYTCAIHPKIRGTNRPPAAVQAWRVLIASQRAVLGPSTFCTPARTESAYGPQKSTCSCQCAKLVGRRASRSAGVAFGVAAYIVSRLARDAAPAFVAWDRRGPWIAGAALAAAGGYQLTPLKTACLRHCRSPLHFLMQRRGGRLGSVRAGLGHGWYCVGCCAGLMLALFALGIMSVFWMAVAAVVILVEKLLPGGETFARVLAVALIALGAWIAVSPQNLPGLHQPDRMPAQMGMPR